MEFATKSIKLIRRITQKVFTPLGEALEKTRITPNHLTLLEIPFIFLMLFYFIKGNLLLAFVYCGVVGVLDILDGMVARLTNQSTRIGHLLDKAIDLLAIGCLMLGISIYSPGLGYLGIVIVLLNVLIFFTNEIRGPTFYTATRTPVLLGLIILWTTGSSAILYLLLYVPIIIGSTLLFVKIWLIIAGIWYGGRTYSIKKALSLKEEKK
jgi:phosphatidylglycerophosphate synthase